MNPEPVLSSNQLKDQVYAYLLQKIVSGDLKPGTRLLINDLAKLLKVSSTPVRESLTLLEKDGLLTSTSYRGFVVRVFSPDEVRDIYHSRAALESYAVRLACRRMDPTAKEQLLRIQEEGKRSFETKNFDGYRTYNEEFHKKILEAAHNKTLSQMVETISRLITMFSLKSIRISERFELGTEEHDEIVKHILAGEELLASTAMEAHILNDMEQSVANIAVDVEASSAD